MRISVVISVSAIFENGFAILIVSMFGELVSKGEGELSPKTATRNRSIDTSNVAK
jgi:hypothetical protein